MKLSVVAFTLTDTRRSLLHHEWSAELGHPSGALRNSNAVERRIVGGNDLFRFQHNDRPGDPNRNHVYRLGESRCSLLTYEYANTRKRNSTLSS